MKKNLVWLMIGLGLLVAQTASAGWVQSGLSGTSINALANNGSNIFAGTANGKIFLSSNNGNNWASVDSGSANTSVNSLAVSGSIIFSGTNYGNVFSSKNNGLNWSSPGLVGNTFNCATMCGSTIFVGTNEGLYQTNNNGATWSVNNSFPTNITITCFAVSGSTIFAGTSDSGIFRSTDTGTNWTKASMGTSASRVYSLAISGGTIFAGTDSGLFNSTNNGANWKAAGLSHIMIESLAASEGNIFAGGDNFYFSTNNGVKWDSGGISYAYSLTVNGNTIFAVTGSGFYQSPINGKSFNWTPSNLSEEVFYLTSSGNTVFAGGNSGLFQSSDNGVTWVTTSGLYDISSLSASGSNILFGAKGYMYSSSLFLSTNSGANWTTILQVLSDTVTSLFSSGNNILAAAGFSQGRGEHLFEENGIIYSATNGSNWTPILDNIPAYSVILAGI